MINNMAGSTCISTWNDNFAIMLHMERTDECVRDNAVMSLWKS